MYVGSAIGDPPGILMSLCRLSGYAWWLFLSFSFAWQVIRGCVCFERIRFSNGLLKKRATIYFTHIRRELDHQGIFGTYAL